MAFYSFIDANITLVFNLLKDLAVEANLNKSPDNDFNFATAEMETGTDASIPVKVVVIKDDKKSKEHNSIRRQVLFKTRGLGDIDAYDTIDIPDEVDPSISLSWKFVGKLNNDGYTVLAEVFREVK